MARPAYTEKFHGKLAAVKIANPCEAPQDELNAPLPQLDALWHYQCVVSPRSPGASKLQSNPSSPRSPRPTSEAIRPDSSGSVSPTVIIGSLSPPFSPPSHSSSSSSATPSPLSRFAPSHQSLQRVFSTFDDNGDGSVSLQEIARIFDKLGLYRSEDSLKSLLADLPSLPGHVDEEEFLMLYESACSFVDANASSSSVNDDGDRDLLAAFHVFDKDGNGFITPAELQSVLCALGFVQGRHLEACVDMIARVDENGDGHVDFFEFKKLFHLDNPFTTTIPTC